MEPIEIALEGVSFINNLKLSSLCSIDGINSVVLRNTVMVSSNSGSHFRQSLVFFPQAGR